MGSAITSLPVTNLVKDYTIFQGELNSGHYCQVTVMKSFTSVLIHSIVLSTTLCTFNKALSQNILNVIKDMLHKRDRKTTRDN